MELKVLVLGILFFYFQSSISNSSYTQPIHCGIDNNVMEMTDHVLLILKIPWFVKALIKTTNEDIVLRICGSENPSNDKDTSLDIYIH